MDQLRTALGEATKSGWAVGSASLDELKREGQWFLHWTTHATRGHPEGADELRPVAKDEARSASLSALHGDGEQPLHTDGAHLIQPGKWLLLVSADVSSVPTLFWPYNAAEISAPVRDAMQEGLFTVVSGARSFLTPARSLGMLRFDPGCMRPSDSRASMADGFLSTRRNAAQEHVWDEPNRFLLLNNHRVLHARGDASAEPGRLLHRINFDIPKAAKR